MNTVVIEHKRGERETCRYLPMDDKEHDGKLRFYAERRTGWRVFILEAVRPHDRIFVDDTGQIAKSPFSDSPVKEIIPCRLLPPPCYASEHEANMDRRESRMDMPFHALEHEWGWKAVYQKTHGEALWVKPDHEKKGGSLRNRLAQMRWAARAEYKQKREAAERIKDQTKRTDRLEALKEIYTAPVHMFHGIECAGILNTTLEMVKRGCGPRNDVLVSEWELRNGVDRVQMDWDAETCRKWIIKHYPNVIIFANKDAVLDPLLASVRYKATFQDGSFLYLTARDSRKLKSSEMAEVGGLRPDPPKTDEAQEKIMRNILKQMKPDDIDREIINLYWKNYSQDKIVAELRKQKRGKSKAYVGRILKEFNNRLEAEGLRAKLRVTGSGLPIGERYRNNRTIIDTTEADYATPSKRLENNELQNIAAQWEGYSPEEKKVMLNEYPQLHSQLRRWHWDRWKTFSPTKQEALLELFPEIQTALDKEHQPPG